MTSMKTMLMVVLDSNAKMGLPPTTSSSLSPSSSSSVAAVESKLDIAVSFMLSFMLKRMMQVKTAEFGIVTYGDNVTNVSNKELEGYDYINEIIPIQRLTKNDLILINESIKPGKEDDENIDMIGGIIVGADRLISVNKGKKYNRIMLLITDCETMLTSTDGLEQTINTLKDEKVPIYVAIMGKVTESSSLVKKENVKLIESIVNDTDGACVEANNLIDCMHLLAGEPGLSTRSQVSKTVFNVSKDISIPCCTWGRVMPSKLPSLKKKVKDPIGNYSDIRRESAYVDSKDPDSALSFDALTHGFKYGKQFVPMGDAEMHAVKVEGAKSISLIGFEKKEKIPRHYFVDCTKVVQGAEGDDGSSIAIATLSRAMWESGDVALCRYVSKENDDPILVVLSPPPKQNGTLLLHRLPCAEDINDFYFPSLHNSKSSSNNIISDLIDSMTVDISQIKKKQITPLNPVALTYTSSVLNKVLTHQDEEKKTYDTFNEIIAPYIDDPEKHNIYKNALSIVKANFKLETVSKAKVSEKKTYWSELELAEGMEGPTKRPRFETTSDSNMNDENDESHIDTNKEAPKIEIPVFDSNGTVEDFETNVDIIFNATILTHEDKMDKLEKLFITVIDIIEKLINKQSNAFYKRAIEMLKAYRNASKDLEKFESFNTFMMKIKEMTVNGKHRPFWDILKNEKVALVSSNENNKSKLSIQMSSDDFFNDTVNVVNETTEVVMNTDDFLDGME